MRLFAKCSSALLGAAAFAMLLAVPAAADPPPGLHGNDSPSSDTGWLIGLLVVVLLLLGLVALKWRPRRPPDEPPPLDDRL